VAASSAKADCKSSSFGGLTPSSNINRAIGLLEETSTLHPARAISSENSGDVPKGSNTQDPLSKLLAIQLEAMPSGMGGKNRESSPVGFAGFPEIKITCLAIELIQL
jgi:hypothetical protein